MFSPRHNVLYFVCHDLGRALGCYGAGIPTPNLDHFAAQGVRFTNAHCASPACSPSRACAMTGLHPHQTGALGLSHMGWALPLSIRTTIDDFNAAGYQTILSGLNHERHPRTDRYEVDMTQDWEDWKLPRAVDNALAALRNRDSNRPFYLNVATQEPHSCIWHDVGGRIVELPESFRTWLPPGMPRTPALDAAFRRFAAAVVYLDAEFGRLMAGLDALGLAESTLVVFTTDHGMAGPRGKGTLLGLGTEIALLMRQPGTLPHGAVRTFPVSNISFRATFAEAAGIEPVSQTAGRSIWTTCRDARAAVLEPALFLSRNFHGEKPWRNEPDYIDCYDPIRGLRTATHLYLRRFLVHTKPAEPHPDIVPEATVDWKDWEKSWPLSTAPRPEEELFDLRRDPLELHNLAADPTHSGVVSAFRAALAEAMKSTGDFLPGPKPTPIEQPGWGPAWPP